MSDGSGDGSGLLWQLGRCALLADLPAAELEALAATGELVDLARRRVLYLPGDPGDRLFLVLAGRVKVSKVTADGRELTLAYRVPFELLGEGCLGGGPREEMAEAVVASRLAAVGRGALEGLAGRHAGFALRLVQLLAARGRELAARAERLVFRGVEPKLAELLLRLAEEHGVDEPRGVRLALKITHQELANLIGVTRETVSVALAQFRRRKLVVIERRQVIITSADGLRALG